jgi:hypothetical protein
MGLREYYQQDAGRRLEVICGIALLGFSGLSGFVAIFGVVQSSKYPRALIATAIFGLLTWGLLGLAFRLLRGQRGIGGTLLSPAALMAGAAIFLFGGLLLIFNAITERDIRLLLGGLSILPATYFSWKFALERRRQSVPPNNSLERTREG